MDLVEEKMERVERERIGYDLLCLIVCGCLCDLGDPADRLGSGECNVKV